MEQLGSHWTDFYEILKFDYFAKICRENSNLIKSDKNNGLLHEDFCTFVIQSRRILEVFVRNCREKLSTRYMFSLQNRAV
jgi:hypothetical protein